MIYPNRAAFNDDFKWNFVGEKAPPSYDRAVWKKVAKGQPVRWDKEVERVWQEKGGNKDEVLSIGESFGVQDKSKGHDRNQGERSAQM